MNYYQPNFYSNYPYNQYQQLQSIPQAQPTISTPTMQVGLQGKMVDGIDIVKVTDVPIGGYGVFPKADLSEIYIKSWNNNGTTNIMTFKPISKEEQEAETKTTNELLEKIKMLNEKIDVLLTPMPAATATTEQPKQQASTAQRKEF